MFFSFFFTEELIRVHHQALAKAGEAGADIEARRATLREAGGTAAEGRASELPLSMTGVPASSGYVDGEGAEGADDVGVYSAPVERLALIGQPGAEEWVDEVRVW